MLKQFQLKQKMNKSIWKGKYYQKSFILILLITSVPGLVVGVGTYWFGVDNVENDLREDHQQHVEQQASHINKQFEDLEMTISHWGFESFFNNELGSVNFVRDFKTSRNLTQNIFLLQESNPLIENVAFYIKSDRHLLFNPEYSVLSKEDSTTYESLLSNSKNIYWHLETDRLPGQKGPGQFSLSLINTIPAGSPNPYGSLIVRLNREKVNQILESLNPYRDGGAFLFDGNKIIASSSGLHEASLEQEIKAKIAQQSHPQDSFIYKLDGHNYSVSYGKINRLNQEWTYVSVSPMSAIIEPMVILSRMILMISVTGLLLSVLMAWLASRKIYAPVENLLKVFTDEDHALRNQTSDEFQIIKDKWITLFQESQQLHEQVKNYGPELSQGFLTQLIQGHLSHYNEEGLRERLESFGWETENLHYLIMDVQLTGLEDIQGRFEASDEGLITFVASNIAEELAKTKFNKVHIMNFHDLSMGLFIVENKNLSINKELLEFGEELTNAINQILNMKVSITIGRKTESLTEIPYLFEEVKQGKYFRTFENQNQIINLQDFQHKRNEYYYPFTIEKEIVQALRVEEKENLNDLIRQFIEELVMRKMKENEIQTGIIQLFSSIQGEILHSGIHPYELFDGRDMVKELSQLREPEGIIKWFINDVIAPFLQKLEGRKNREQKRIVEQVIQSMKENYMNDISLESYADMIATNPYTLSKTFKQTIGINFIDYLTELRMEKAKEMLTGTEMKINEIAEQVGYRPSYFNRIFKKNTGLTPSSFRQNQKLQEMQNDMGSKKLPK
ncbi:AraC family transcriptional regulator [Mesobacillus foraminis]|uniref:helix-turn-helix domain-containing protein n=1 Tax=Mesobacillus foraminis TaxID=279826 RepID=UPI001BE5F9DF|nr:AraC family transcriptional regulator [Mesobacillus foraminis]MBT2758868.1 AraC family transcriptional regulator [Mesobacillus foraminis]